MRRRQFPTGNLFEDSNENNAQNQINYTLRKPVQVPTSQNPPVVQVQPKPQVQSKKLIQPQDEDFRDTFLKQEENEQERKHENPEQHQQINSAPPTQLTKAQQLIQQSQALLNRRRQRDIHPQDQQVQEKQPQITQQIIQEQHNIDQQQYQNEPQQQQYQQDNHPVLQNQFMPVNNQQPILDQPQVMANQIKMEHQNQQIDNNVSQQQPVEKKINKFEKYPGPIMNKGQRSLDYTRNLKHFWHNFDFEQDRLLELAIFNLEKNIFKEGKSEALKFIETEILNDQDGQHFTQAFEKFILPDDWEGQLFLTLLKCDQINIMQQEKMIEYLDKKEFNDINQVLLMKFALIFKMEQSNHKESYHQNLQTKLLEIYQEQQITARQLWIALKMYPSFLNDKNLKFPNFYIGFFTKQLDYALAETEIQIYLSDSYQYFQNQFSSELYYKLALLKIEQNTLEKALECAKISLELGNQNARELRHKIVVLIQQEFENKNKTNNQNNNSNSTGLFGYFNAAVKSITKRDSQKQEQQVQKKDDFYFDKELNTWVINGVPQLQEEITEKQTEKTAPPPPPPKQTHNRPQPIPIDHSNIEELKKEKQEIQHDPFGQPVQHQHTQERVKKNNILRNRYVQS